MNVLKKPSSRSESPAITLFKQPLSYSDAQGLAQDLASRFPTFKEFMMALKEDPKLYELAKDRVYWLHGESWTGSSGFCRIDYENFTFVSVSQDAWKKLPDSERAFAHEGDGHLVLYVFTGNGVGRFSVGQQNMAGDVASVALIIPVEDRRSASESQKKTGVRGTVDKLGDRIAEILYILLRK